MKLSPINLAAIYHINGHTPKNGRKPQSRPFPYNGCLPFALRNHVSAKGEKSQGVACVYEMAELLACMKLQDFNEKMCSKESLNFKNCFKNHRETSKVKQERDKDGVLAPGETNLSTKQLNNLLSQFKQPNIKR